MTEAEWLACEDPILMLKALWDVATTRQLALFSCACCRSDRSLMRSRGNQDAVIFSERLIEGEEVPAEDTPTENAYFEKANAVYRSMYVALSVRPNDLGHAFRFVGLALEAMTGDKPNPKRANRRIAAVFREVFGNPFRPVELASEWRSGTALSLAKHIYESRDFSTMPILADALQDAGCDNAEILNHCRAENVTHVRGCWVVDLVLGKQ